MVMSRNKVLVVLEDGDALLMQPPNSRCGAFIILADNLRRTQRFLQSNMLSQLASCRAHNLILQPAISMSEFTAHVAAAPSAWVGAAGGSPLRDQGLAPLVNIQPDRSALSRCYMSACNDSICTWPAASAQMGSHVHVVLPLYMVVFCGSELHTGKQKTPELQVWVSGPMLVQGE